MADNGKVIDLANPETCIEHLNARCNATIDLTNEVKRRLAELEAANDPRERAAEIARLEFVQLRAILQNQALILGTLSTIVGRQASAARIVVPEFLGGRVA